MWGIFHEYTVDGGVGDAIRQERLLGLAETEELAKAYVNRWSNDQVYDRPYDELHCGRLFCKELPRPVISSEFDIYGSPYELWGIMCNPMSEWAAREEDDWCRKTSP